jgi:hypothetical protein
VPDAVAPLPALPEPNGGKTCDGINPPPAPPLPLLLPDRKTLLVFLRFFHLARRFWNQTYNQPFNNNLKKMILKNQSNQIQNSTK